MMRAALYDGDGRIIQRLSGSVAMIDATASAMGILWLEVPDEQPYDATHRVLDGAIVPIGDGA